MVTWKIKGLYKADAEAVYSEFNMAGTFIGVGSRRGEGYGRFHVTEVK